VVPSVRAICGVSELSFPQISVVTPAQLLKECK